MVEGSGDKKGGSDNLVHGGEKRVWNRFLRHFNLEDTHVLEPHFQQFSWDNKRAHI